MTLVDKIGGIEMSSKTKKLVFQMIKKYLGQTDDIPIVDAKTPLRLQPQACDQEGADPLDPGNCLLVHTARRMYNARAVIFWKTLAYVALVGEDGKLRLERFLNPKKTRERISLYDNGQMPITELPLVLLPPSRGKKLGATRQLDSHRHTKRRQIIVQRSDARKALTVAEAQLERAKELRIEAESRGNSVVKLRDLKMREATAKAIVRKKADRLSTLMKEDPKPKRTAVLDLTTRNGATGHYRFSGLT